MIATISPAASSADHTINTLRYADRVKEKKVGEQARAAPAGGMGGGIGSAVADGDGGDGGDVGDGIGSNERESKLRADSRKSESKSGEPSGDYALGEMETVDDGSEAQNAAEKEFNEAVESLFEEVRKYVWKYMFVLKFVCCAVHFCAFTLILLTSLL